MVLGVEVLLCCLRATEPGEIVSLLREVFFAGCAFSKEKRSGEFSLSSVLLEKRCLEAPFSLASPFLLLRPKTPPWWALSEFSLLDCIVRSFRREPSLCTLVCGAGGLTCADLKPSSSSSLRYWLTSIVSASGCFESWSLGSKAQPIRRGHSPTQNPKMCLRHLA